MGRGHDYYKVGAGNNMGVIGTQESQSKGGESDIEYDGDDYRPTTNTTGPGTPWGSLGTQKTE